jgi:hypothetical protein
MELSQVVTVSSAPEFTLGKWPVKGDMLLNIGTESDPMTLSIKSAINFANLTGISSNIGNPSITFRVSRGTLVKKEQLHTNDRILSLVATGYHNDAYVFSGAVTIGVDPGGCISKTALPSMFQAITVAEDNNFNCLEFDSKGHLKSPILQLSKSFASVKERDETIPYPLKGTIILVDDPITGESYFQGYTGKKWVKFHE